MNNNNVQPTRACSNSSLRSAPATRKRSRQCFLNQKTGQKQKTLKSLTQSLKDLSSGSPVESLLEFYLFHSKQGTKYMKRIKRDITTKKIEETMKNVGELFNNAHPEQKKVILSTVIKSFTIDELERKYRFAFGKLPKKTIIKAKEIAKIKPGKHQKKIRETKQLPQDQIKEIAEFYESDEVSRPSPNIEVITKRIVDKENKKILKFRKNVRYLQVGGTRHAFTLYRKKYPNRKTSLSSFRKYTPKNIKKAKRDSDLCTLCADGFKNKKKLERTKKKLENLVQNSTTSSDDYKILELKNELIVLQKNNELFEEHRRLKDQIHKNFDEQKKNLKDGDVMLVMDFKENIALGKCQKETSRDFYDAPQRSIFCIASLSKKAKLNNETGLPSDEREIVTNYFDYISDILNHDSKFAFDCLNNLIEGDDFSEFEVKNGNNVYLWADNAGQHFRTFEFLYEFLQLQKRYPNVKFHLNYFAEYHGKNICDSHFARLNSFYNSYTTSNEFAEPIYTTGEFISLLQKAVLNSNEAIAYENSRKKKGTKLKKLLYSKFFVYDRTEKSHNEVFFKLIANNFTSYYNFTFQRNQNDELLLAAKYHEFDGHTRYYSPKIVAENRKPTLKRAFRKSKNTIATNNEDVTHTFATLQQKQTHRDKQIAKNLFTPRIANRATLTNHPYRTLHSPEN